MKKADALKPVKNETILIGHSKRKNVMLKKEEETEGGS